MSETPMDEQSGETRRAKRRTERSQNDKKSKVVSYLAVLFAAAFLLLLMSYFMQQRTNQEAIDGLKQSVSSIHSLQNLIDVNEALEEENAALQSENRALKSQMATLQADNTSSDKALEAMDYLRRIQMFYYAGAYRSARIVVESMEEADLQDQLPTETHYQNSDQSVLSPAEEYQRIYNALY